MKPALPQRCPCMETERSWSASIALLDDLIAALRVWQPRELSPSAPTEQDMAAIAALHSISLSSPPDTVAPDQR